MRPTVSILGIITSLFFAGLASAVPTMVPYVGYLVHDSGAPVSAIVDVQVEIFSAQVSGDSVWGPHVYEGVTVADGLFTLALGGSETADLAPALDGGTALWIAFHINGEAMWPRQRILSVPFARRAEHAANASHLGGLPANAYAALAELPNAALSGSYDDLTDIPSDLVQGTGTPGALSRFAGAGTLADSLLVQADDRVGLNEAAPQSTLHVGGTIQLGDDGAPCTAARAGSLRWTGSAVEVCDGEAWGALGGGQPGGGDPGGEDGDPLFEFTSHDFTHCGQEGASGPTLSMCQSSYQSPGATAWKSDPALYSMADQGIQRFTVPATGSYRIAARGAEGGYPGEGGRGALIEGTFDLQKGDVLHIAVGQRGSAGTFTSGGGGGGSFVVLEGITPLVIAGGGGASGACTTPNGGPGLTTQAGGAGTVGSSGGQGGAGGVQGNGGKRGSASNSGCGGGGFLTDGEDSGTYTGGRSFHNGLAGGVGSHQGIGGFGGGAGSGNHGGAGGGGYSGGGGGTPNCPAGVGGGGGSFNGGSAQVNTAGANLGHGLVTLTRLDGPGGGGPEEPPAPDPNVWTPLDFDSVDLKNGCTGGAKYVKGTAYSPGAWVGVQLCSATRYKIFLSTAWDGTFHSIGDGCGSGEDHCEFVGGTHTSFSVDYSTNSGQPGWTRCNEGDNPTFGTLSGAHWTPSWNECGVSIP